MVDNHNKVATMLDYTRVDFEFRPVSTRLDAARDDSEQFVQAVQ